MPLHNRSGSSLPDIDEAEVPFSSLFGGDGSFDQASVESAALLADNSVFVTATGRRFRLQRIPENQSTSSAPATPPQSQGTDSATTAPSPRRSTFSGVSMDNRRNTFGGHARSASEEPKVPTEDVTNMMSHLNVERFGASGFYGQSDGGVHTAQTLTRNSLSNGPGPETQMNGTMGIGVALPYPELKKAYLYDVHTNAAKTASLDYSLSGSTGSSRDSYLDYHTTALAPPGVAPPMWHSPVDVLPLKIDVTSQIDTQTPVVVAVHPSSSNLTTSDTASTGRDNELPGEEVLWDGQIQCCPTMMGPFEDAHLRVFRNTLTNDLRFHCRRGSNSETYWMKGSAAQLVPMYAYDPRSQHLLFVRDTSRAVSYPQSQGGAVGPSGIYQFQHLADLFRFQSQLTGEDVVLDISSVKWVKLAKASKRSHEMYSSVRLQIWHEPRSRRTRQSDVASFVTAGTALSGPARDRVVPNASRLVVFLGRAEEYITCFVSDDIEIELKDGTSVKLKSRKYGGFNRRSSRPGVKACLTTRGKSSEPAGLDIHGQPYSPDIESTFDVYKTFEIEFESSPSQVNFVQAWKEIMDERRKQRSRLAKIQEEMRKESFTGRTALSIRM